MVSGFHKPPANRDIKNKSEEGNAGSIVIRLIHKVKSTLLCGGGQDGSISKNCNL